MEVTSDPLLPMSGYSLNYHGKEIGLQRNVPTQGKLICEKVEKNFFQFTFWIFQKFYEKGKVKNKDKRNSEN